MTHTTPPSPPNDKGKRFPTSCPLNAPGQPSRDRAAGVFVLHPIAGLAPGKPRHLFLLTLCLAITLGMAGPRASFGQTPGRGLPLSSAPAPSGAAAEKQAGGEAKEEGPTGAQSFPGLAEIVPRSSQVTLEATKVRDRLAVIGQTGTLEKRLVDAESQQQRMADQIGKMGDPRTWDFNRLMDYRLLVQGARRDYDSLLAQISAPLIELEAQRREWEAIQGFWEGWKRQFDSSPADMPHDTFKRVLETTGGVLQELSRTSGGLIALQERARNLIEASLALGNPIDAALAKLRSETFKRVEPILPSSEFLAQLDLAGIGRTLKDNGEKLLRTEATFLASYLWLLLVRLALILVVGAAIVRSRAREIDSERWSFIVGHPWASGILVSHAVRMMATGEIGGSFNLLTQILTVFSCALLASDLMKDTGKRRALYLVASLLVLTETLKLIAFSTPLYRLYLFGMNLAGLTATGLWARNHARSVAGRLDGLSGILLVGCVSLAVSLLANLFGFVNLAEWILFGIGWTVFVGVGIHLVFLLCVFALERVLGLPSVSGLRFFSRYGKEFGQRLNLFMGVAAWGWAIVLLSLVWGIFASPSQVWQKVFESRIELGGLSLSLGLLLLALFTLYLAGSISWFLRAFLEAEVFPRNQVERGAGDAVKKLLHYSVMLIGFLMGISILGIDIKSFFVLGGALGIGIGFGLQNVANNFISGLILLFERPIKIGDMVVVDNESGRVRKIGLRSTVIETLDRAELIVPNSQFISEKVTNWTFSNPLARLRIPVGVAYGTDIPLVLGLLREVALANPRVLKNPQPLAIFIRFGDSSLDFELHVWIADVAERLTVQSDIGQGIAASFREAEIEIPYPQRDVHIRSSQE